jgi:hypothetical protein
VLGLWLSRSRWLLLLIVSDSWLLLLLWCSGGRGGSWLISLLLLSWNVLLWLCNRGWLFAVDLEGLGLSEDGVIESGDVSELVEERSVDDLFEKIAYSALCAFEDIHACNRQLT